MVRVFIKERITESPTGCWLWNRSHASSGYGDFRMNGKHYLAHRASYEAFIGPIPVGMWVLHKCDVRSCVNPEHLFLGTNQDNIADSVRKGRRKGITRKRPSGLIYAWTTENKKQWIERKRKIKEEDRKLILREYLLGAETHRSLAKKYGVSSALIHRIVHGE